MLLSNRAMKGSNPGKLYAMTNALTTDRSAYTSKGNWQKPGMVRNFHCGDARVPGIVAATSAALGGSISGTTFTDTVHGSGYFAPGQALSGNGVTSGTVIKAFLTGTGANNGGTYSVNISQTVTSQTITGTAPSFTVKASQPSGNTHPVAFVLPQKPGMVASRKQCFTVLAGGASAKIGSLIFTSACIVGLNGSATGTLIIGSKIDGTTAIVMDGLATGSATLGAAGTSSVTIGADGSILGHLLAAGSSPIVLGAIADLRALGWLSGSGTIVLDGLLGTTAIGWLEGSTEDKSALTSANIASAVWESIAAAFNTPGSMGAALLAAGSAGDPWGTPLPGNYVQGSAGSIIGAMTDIGAAGQEVAAVPGPDASLEQKLTWLFQYFAHKKVVGLYDETLYSEDEGTVIGQAPITKTGTSVVKGKMV